MAMVNANNGKLDFRLPIFFYNSRNFIGIFFVGIIVSKSSLGNTESNPAADVAAVAERINFLRLYAGGFIFDFFRWSNLKLAPYIECFVFVRVCAALSYMVITNKVGTGYIKSFCLIGLPKTKRHHLILLHKLNRRCVSNQ